MLLETNPDFNRQRFRAALRLGWAGLLALHLPVLVAVCILASFSSGPASAAELRIKVESLKQDRGDVLLYVFYFRQAESFPVKLDDAVCHRSAPADAAAVEFVCTDLPRGDYAAIAMQDLNSNGVLDHSWLRMPAEPLGFSTGCRPILGPPSFERCRFAFSQEEPLMTIKLR